MGEPRIADLRLHRRSVPLHRPFVTALRTVHTVDAVLVELRDGDGRVGWGEAVPTWRITGETAAGIEAALSGPLRDAVLGREVADVDATLGAADRALRANTSAKAALDMAVHDLWARGLGTPLARLLGGTATSVRSDLTLSAGTAPAMVAAAGEAVTAGFRTLKVKLGKDPAGDVERVCAVRSAVGTEVALRLDANQGWTAKQAVRILGQLQDAGADLELVEQPVPAADLEGLAYVTARTAVPVLADESAFCARDVLELLRRSACDLVNIKLAKCGGLRPALAMLAVADAAGVGCLVGGMMEGTVAVTAAACLAAARLPAVVHDLDAAGWLARPTARGGVRYDGDRLLLSAGPGLGIDGPAG